MTTKLIQLNVGDEFRWRGSRYRLETMSSNKAIARIKNLSERKADAQVCTNIKIEQL